MAVRVDDGGRPTKMLARLLAVGPGAAFVYAGPGVSSMAGVTPSLARPAPDARYRRAGAAPPANLAEERARIDEACLSASEGSRNLVQDLGAAEILRLLGAPRLEADLPGPPAARPKVQAFWPVLESGVVRYTERLDTLYEQSFSIRCPFFRRRAFDTIEALKRILLFIVARHKSTPFFPSPDAAQPAPKAGGLALADVAAAIHGDWVGQGPASLGKGYYITGRVTRAVYDEDCLFDGPDPDMPVRGLQKYLSSASQLFDTRRSRADLRRPIEYDDAAGTVVAHWRLEGVLNLPWHPPVKPWTGSTTYHVDRGTGLIVTHREEWDISVPDAFISTLAPWLEFGAPAARPVDSPAVEPPRPARGSGTPPLPSRF